MRLSFRLSRSSFLLIAACSSGDAGRPAFTTDTLPGGIVRVVNHSPADSGKWSLVLDRTIDPPLGSPGEIGSINDIALGDDGTLFISESKPVHVTVIGRDGNFVRTIGRDGDGPGEFRNGYLAVRGDTLVLHDPRTARATTFRISDGKLLGVRPTVCCNYGPIQINGEGQVIAPTIVPSDSLHPAAAYARFSLDGSRLDTVRIVERPRPDGKRWRVMEGGLLRFEMQVPLRPRDLHAADAAGSLLSGWNGEYLVHTSRTGSDTVSIFGRDYSPESVSAAMKQQRVDAIIKTNQEYTAEAILRTSLDPAAIPDQRPAYERIWTDRSGRRWLQLSRNDTTAITLDLFDTTGRWRDQISLSADGWPRDIWGSVAWSRDEVAVVSQGDDDRDVVKIYRIVHRP